MGTGQLASMHSSGAVVDFRLTARYFRAMAKVGFHYFLTQFPQYQGHEPIFSDIRRYISDDESKPGRANEFMGKRQQPLLGEMLAGARPAGWRAHVLCAEISKGDCDAHLQMFVAEDWQAPAYTIRLTRGAGFVGRGAAGHAYIYYDGGPAGRYSGDAFRLTPLAANFSFPPLEPVIQPA